MKSILYLIFTIILIQGCSKIDYTTDYTYISGQYNGNYTWSKNIMVTGDTVINGSLTIEPGTIVKIRNDDDQKKGNKFPKDGFNDNDPTRTKNYERKHILITVENKLIANASQNKKIIFTSAQKHPKNADWIGLKVNGDYSIIVNTLFEWSRSGLILNKNQPNTIVQYNKFNNTFWGAISSTNSSAKIINNIIYNSGHEGIDVQGGSPQLQNNLIFDSHTGIVVLSGNAKIINNSMQNVGNGIFIGKGATPTLADNKISLASDNANLKWFYNRFFYTLK